MKTKKAKKDYSKYLKTALFIAAISFGLFFVFTIVCGTIISATGDPDISNFLVFISYPFTHLGKLLTFGYTEGLANGFLCAFSYFFIVIPLLYAIVGLVIYFKKKRKEVIMPIIASLLTTLAYIFFTILFSRFISCIFKEIIYTAPLPVLYIFFIGVSLFFFVFVIASYLSLFMSILVVTDNPQSQDEEEPDKLQ